MYEQYVGDENCHSIGRALFYLSMYGVPINILEVLIFDGDGYIYLYGKKFASVHWFSPPHFVFFTKRESRKEWEKNQEERSSSVLKYERALIARNEIIKNLKEIERLMGKESMVLAVSSNFYEFDCEARKLLNG